MLHGYHLPGVAAATTEEDEDEEEQEAKRRMRCFGKSVRERRDKEKKTTVADVTIMLFSFLPTSFLYFFHASLMLQIFSVWERHSLNFLNRKSLNIKYRVKSCEIFNAQPCTS